MSRDLKHQSLERTFNKVAQLEFENDEDEITNNIFPNDNDTYEDSDTDSDDSDDSSNGGSVDLGLADDLKESDSAMQCVLELEDVVNDLLGVKDRLLALYPLPTEVQLHLVIPLTKLTRLKNTLKPSVRYLQKIAKIFASGELSNEMVKHMRTVLAAAQAELAMEKKRRVELDRKIHTLTFQSDHQHRQVQLIRWLKLFSSLRRREIQKAHKHKVTHLQHVVASLRRKFHRTEDKVDDLKRELQITKVEAEAMIKQAHQSRKLAEQQAAAANANNNNYNNSIAMNNIGTHQNIAHHHNTGRNINNRSPSSASNNRPSTANTVASSIDGSYNSSHADLHSLNEDMMMMMEEEITMDEHGNPSTAMKPKSEMTEEEKQAKKEAKRKAKQLQKEFDAQFEKAMLEVREKHHDGENGIKDLDAKEAFEIYKKAAAEKEKKMHEEEMRQKAAKESSWHKRYFKKHDEEDKNVSSDTVNNNDNITVTSSNVNDEEEKSETNNVNSNNDANDNISNDDANNISNNDVNNNTSNNVANNNNNNVFGMMDNNNNNNIPETYELMLQENRDKIDRLEMMVRGLEAQMRLKDHTIEDLRAQITKSSGNLKKNGRYLKHDPHHSAKNNDPAFNYNVDNHHGRMQSNNNVAENNMMFFQQNESLRPWTSTTVVRRNSKTNSMELPAKFIPIRMPPNQPYRQNRFKTKPLYQSNTNAKKKNNRIRDPRRVHLNSVNFTNRIMQAQRPASQRTARSRTYY